MSPRNVKLRMRDALPRNKPNRTAGNFYRAASDNPDVRAGIPLDSLESAVTSAVRIAYKVADAQIDRAARLAKRMRDAGDRAAGKESDKKALDATEQMIFKAMMAGLGWLEGVAANPGNPLRRLATAEFQLLGSLLGLLPSAESSGTGPHRDTVDFAEGTDERVAPIPQQPIFRERLPLIKHDLADGAAGGRRPVRVRNWEIASDSLGDYGLTFCPDKPGLGSITGTLNVRRTGSAILTMRMSVETTAPGVYKAAICNAEGVQLGFVEIEL